MYLIYIKLLLLGLLIAVPVTALGEWVTKTYRDNQSGPATRVAVTVNDDGYKLEIYRDGNGAIRSRFSTDNTSNRLDDQYCPTFDIERRGLQNVSINGESCLMGDRWAEFVLGYIKNNEVISTPLHNHMNGRKITFRFILQPYGYAETSFSLHSSKRVLLDALGYDLTVRTDSGYAN